MAILRPTDEVEGEAVIDQKEFQPPPSEGDEVMKATELKYETADPKITTAAELPDPQRSKGQDDDESNSPGENSHSASTSDKESMSKLRPETYIGTDAIK